jgi:hypothetical protein
MTSSLVSTTSSALPVADASGGNPAVVAAAPAAALREVRGVISGRQQLDNGKYITGWDVTVSDLTGSITVHVPSSVYNHQMLLGLRMGAALSVLGRVDEDRVLAVVLTGLVPPGKVAEHLASREGTDTLARLGW